MSTTLQLLEDNRVPFLTRNMARLHEALTKAATQDAATIRQLQDTISSLRNEPAKLPAKPVAPSYGIPTAMDSMHNSRSR